MAPRKTGRAVMLGLFLWGTMLSASCESFTAYCEEANDCADGNELDLDACVTSKESESERASLFGCSEWLDLYNECVEAEAKCNNKFYGPEGDDCLEESIDYQACMGS